MQSSHGHVDDLATLATLDEASMLKEIKSRYENDLIYTYIGDILVAVNPYKTLTIYGPEIGLLYTDVKEKSSHPPHVYAISDNVYQTMRRTGVDQSCVVSGESGAGKTETTKLMVQHIAQLCKDESSDLHDRIVQINPLLEAFGNARTVINNNSSRFGKFIQLLFDTEGRILGAQLTEYLLEKSRVVSQGPGERSFHIFYYMFAGLSETQLKANLLYQPEKHRILQPGDGSSVYQSDEEWNHNKTMWARLHEIMKTVGFNKQEVSSIEAVLAAILHVTDVEFAHDSESDGVYVVNGHILETACELLNVPPETLASALISNITNIGVEKVMSLKNLSQAKDGRDALAKALYGRMFGWIVGQINDMLQPDSSRRVGGPAIGILDIAGFENFKQNSFEQLCINVANEQLQFYFNQHIFRWELDEYAKEGVKGKDIKFTDNRPLVDLFLQTPIGLFSLLDEESKFPQATDATLVDKLTKNLAKKQLYEIPKGHLLQFIIHHYAGSVTYNGEGFLEKNRDSLSWNLIASMKSSESQFVADLFRAQDSSAADVLRGTGTGRRNKRSRQSILLVKAPAESKNKGALGRALSIKVAAQAKPRSSQSETIIKTLGSHFTKSLTDLVTNLQGDPHFIRCIKPNTQKRSGTFADKIVQEQLRYTGVMETVKIRRQGYSTRILFKDFFQRYKFLGFPLSENVEHTAANCAKILKMAGVDDFEMGKTKVFLRYWHLEQIHLITDKITWKVILCQAIVRAFLCSAKYNRIKKQLEAQKRALRALSGQVSQVNGQKSRQLLDHQHEDQMRFEKMKKEREEKEAERIRQEQVRLEAERQKQEAAKKAAERQEALKQATVQEAITRQSASLGTAGNVLQSTSAGPLLPPRKSSVPTVPISVMRQYQQELLDDALSKYQMLSNQIWAKVLYFEKEELVGKVYLRDWEVIIDNSTQVYDGRVIGLRTQDFLNEERDPKTNEILEQLAKGVKLTRDAEGNVFGTRLSTKDVIAKGYISPDNCLSDELVRENGQLQSKPMKIFDIGKFKIQMAVELKKPYINQKRLEMLSMVSFAFVKNTFDDSETPCWVSIINFCAIDLLGLETVLPELIQMSGRRVQSFQEVELREHWKGMFRERCPSGLRNSEAAYGAIGMQTWQQGQGAHGQADERRRPPPKEPRREPPPLPPKVSASKRGHLRPDR